MTDPHNCGWAAVIAKPQAERIAEAAIAEAGFIAWLPLYRKRLKGTRIEDGRRIRSRQDGVEQRPLFPGYLFAQVPHDDPDETSYAIDLARGVLRMMRHPSTGNRWGKPKIIRARVIELIREAVEAGEFDEVGADTPITVMAGDTVRTPSGIVGTIRDLDDKGRAELAYDLFGRAGISRGVDARTLERVG